MAPNQDKAFMYYMYNFCDIEWKFALGVRHSVCLELGCFVCLEKLKHLVWLEELTIDLVCLEN